MRSFGLKKSCNYSKFFFSNIFFSNQIDGVCYLSNCEEVITRIKVFNILNLTKLILYVMYYLVSKFLKCRVLYRFHYDFIRKIIINLKNISLKSYR